ncbi:hypothetical protein OXX80_006689 [Metschnikowia pulcherrima]
MFGAGSSAGTGFSAQNKPASFSFGSANTNTANNTAGTLGSAGSGFSLGGSNANNTGGFGSKPPGTGFGASASNTNSGATGGLFGSSNTATNSAPAAGGLFGNTGGNTANTTNPSGGLFGASNTNTAGNTGTSLFGGNNAGTGATSTFGKPASGLGSSFGATGTSQAPQNNSTGGLFGSSQPSQPAQSTGGGLFGKPAGNTSGGLFGSNNTQNQPPASSGGGLFGNKGTSGGLFGSQQASSNSNTTQGLNTGFNSTLGQGQGQNLNAGPEPAANNAQPSFSWSNTQQQAAPQTNLSNLEIKLPSAAKSTQNTTSYTPAVNDQLSKLREQWDPRSSRCVLKTHLYNKFSEQEIAVLLQQPRPADETPEDWEKAMANRPSPLHYPVKVSSFSDVAQRVEVQLEHVAKSRIFLNTVYDKSVQLSAQRDLDTTTRIMKAQARHTKLSRRLLKLASLLAVLKLKGYPLLPEEEELSREFQILNAKLSDPNGAVGKLSDLYARLAILKTRSEDLSSHLESSISTMNGGLDTITQNNVDAAESASQTEAVVQSLTKLLYKQQVGLGYLNDVLQQDLATVEKRARK